MLVEYEYEYDALGRRILAVFYDENEDVDKIVRYYHNDRWQVVYAATDNASEADLEQESVFGDGIDELVMMYNTTSGDPNSAVYYLLL